MPHTSHHVPWRLSWLGSGVALGITATLAAQFAGSVVSPKSFIPDVANLGAAAALDSQQSVFVWAVLAVTVASIAAAVWGWKVLRADAGKVAKAQKQRLAARATPTAGTIASQPSQSEFDDARAEIEKQLAALVGYVSRYLNATSDQALRIAQAESRLEQATTIEQVQVVIRLLVASNAQARRDADDLKARLLETKNQAAKIRSNLEQAVNLATLDSLTNLPNRRRLEEFLTEQIAQSHRDHTPLCLVMADIDHFKAINDKFGHPSGDAVLKQFAEILSKNLRHTDFSARYGGEEFVVVLPRTPLGNASHLTEALRRKLSEVRWIGMPSTRSVGKVTASFGVAEIRDDETLEQFVDRADQKLYEAKQNGRNRIEVDHSS